MIFLKTSTFALGLTVARTLSRNGYSHRSDGIDQRGINYILYPFALMLTIHTTSKPNVWPAPEYFA